MNGENKIQPGQCAGAGALAGLIAGIVMALVAMLRAMNHGLSFWLPMQQIAGWIFGVDALLGGWVPTTVGVAIHLAMSAGFGLVFGLIIGRLTAGVAFWAGIFYGICIWAVMTFVVLPALDPVMLSRVGLAPTWWFGFHLIYGVLLTLTAPFARAFASNRQPQNPEGHPA